MRTPKKVFWLLVTLFWGFFIQSAGAQSSLSDTPDARLYEAFGTERVNFLQQNNPDLIRYYNFYLDNAFVLVQHPAEKVSGNVNACPLLVLNNPALKADVPDMKKGTKSINILKYGHQIANDRSTTYRLDDSGIVIVFLSAQELTAKYNASRNL